MTADTENREQIWAVGAGCYSDGHPYDAVHYLECKLILTPHRFTSVAAFQEFGAFMGGVAKTSGVGVASAPGMGSTPTLREVMFFDTPDFRLYNNAFILRRRTRYEHGFAIGDPEIVFKFRHADLCKAAEVDVRPRIAGNYRVKFKAEMLPLRDRLGGYRMLFSHNTQFGLSQVRLEDSNPITLVAEIFPPLDRLADAPDAKVELVNHMVVEELLLDLGVLEFGKGVTAECNVALWRSRAEHTPLVGEFAFQCKFKRCDELHDKAMHRCRELFINLQTAGREWVLPGTTKTGVVYRFNGNVPQNHE